MNNRNYYPLYLCLFLTLISYGQTTISFQSLGGYEPNTNRAPEFFINEDQDQELERKDLYLGGVYQDIEAKLAYRYKTKTSLFKIGFAPELRFFYDEPNANLAVYNGSLYHKYSFSKHTQWENKLTYKRKQREGQDLDQNELSVPLGYQWIGVTSGLHFRLYKSNRSLFRLSFGEKTFDDSDTRKVSYYKYGGEFRFKQVFWSNHLLHSYGVKASFFNRDYAITQINDGKKSDRTWQYIGMELFYDLPIDKRLSVEMAVNYEKRDDVTNSRFGYKQWTPSLGLEFENDRCNVKLTSSYTIRDFDGLMANDIEEEEIGYLKYRYTRLQGSIAYHISSKFSLVAEGSFINRNSNNEDETTTAYRSYRNYYTGIGLRWNIL